MRIIPLLTLSVLIGSAGLASAAEYKIDGTHSHVGFNVMHLGVAPNYGRFNTYNGSITFDPAKPESASVSVTIDVNSIDTNNEKRDAHLKAPDFFDVAQYPTITYKGTGFTAVAGKTDTWTVKGTLTMHGVSQELPLTIVKTGEGKGMQGEQRIGFTTSATIKRTAFGMDQLLKAVGDEVTLTVAVEGVQQ